jgi:hypothetical protein
VDEETRILDPDFLIARVEALRALLRDAQARTLTVEEQDAVEQLAAALAKLLETFDNL